MMKPRQPYFLFIAFSILALISINQLSAQQNAERCAFDQQHKKALENENYRNIRNQMEAFIRQYATQQMAEDRTFATINIPCVVHVIHTGQAVGTATSTGANPNDAQINSAIADMNAAFTHTGVYSSKTAYTAAMDVSFTLAKTTPEGAATSGIIRYDVSGEPWGTDYGNNGMDAGQTPGVPQATITGSRFWPPMDYMNIWIVHEVENATSTLGFASFPQSNPGATDGLTVLASAFGYDPENDDGFLLDAATNLNGTTNHETGHYLNLYHTFTGDNNGTICPPDNTCGTDSDCCADIPAHIRTNSTCPADSPTGNSCGGGPNTFIHNFMDYASDACFHGFSNDQKTRMDAALASQRLALSQSKGDETVVANYPAAAATAPSVTNHDQTMGIYDITLNGTTFKSWSSYHDGGYMNRIASQPRVVLGHNLMYSMTVQVGVGNTANNELVNVYIDYNNNGSFGDSGENVFTAAGGSGKKNGESFSFSFTTPTQGGSTPSNVGLRLRIVSDFDTGSPLSSSTSVTQGGQIEDYTIQINHPLPVELISFDASLIRTNDVLLSWYTASEVDNAGFEIQRSKDGRNFEKVAFIEGAGNSSSMKKYVYEDLNQSASKWYYRLKQIDLDHSFEYSPIAVVEISEGLAAVNVYPNPVENQLTLEISHAPEDQATIELFDISGRRLVHLKNQSVRQSFDLNEWGIGAGLYFIRVQCGSLYETIKFSKVSK